MKKLLLMSVCLTCIMTGCGKKEYSYETIDREKVVTTLGGIYEYSESYSNIHDLAEGSDCVVYGEVVDLQYSSERNGVCTTQEHIKVLQSLKGTSQKDETLTVSKLQGYLSVEDYLDSFDKEARQINRDDFSQYQDNELNDIYVAQISQGDTFSEIGQKGVYFLKKSADAQSYYRLNECEGEYLEISDDAFIRMNTIETDSSLYSEDEPNTFTENISSTPKTLSELIDEINVR